MGTPAFAAPVLEALSHAHRVKLVVTRPDEPKGRGLKLTPTPVKEKALALGLPVAQPVALKDPAFQDLIAAQKADILVVVAFRILPAALFPLARLGALNIHGSLLPKYRGAAPIQWAIAQGEKETGVTIFRLDAEIDHGEILARSKTPIGPEETAGELFARLSVMGRDLLLETLAQLEAGTALPVPQDHTLATPAPKLKKEDGLLNWKHSAQTLHDRIRAFNPYPICYTRDTESGRVLRIHRSRMRPGQSESGKMIVESGHPCIGTGDGLLELVEVQWEGGPKVSGVDFINGLRGTGKLIRF